MKKNNLSSFAIIVIIAGTIILFGNHASGLDSVQNSSSLESKATLCIQNSEQIMKDMSGSGFNVQSINDSLNQAKSLYSAQIILESSGRKPNFLLVMSYCDDISKIKNDAYNSIDGLNALEKFYNESITSEINSSEIDALINSIKSEIKNERYDLALTMINDGYDKISALKSSSTRAKLIYESTSRGIQRFITNNYILLIAIAVILIIGYFAYRTKIAKKIINGRIIRLELRKKTIQNLIMNTQKGYFEKGDISETSYNIKIKKFAELIRDIDRQIPLLREELVKLEKKSPKRKK